MLLINYVKLLTLSKASNAVCSLTHQLYSMDTQVKALGIWSFHHLWQKPLLLCQYSHYTLNPMTNNIKKQLQDLKITFLFCWREIMLKNIINTFFPGSMLHCCHSVYWKKGSKVSSVLPLSYWICSFPFAFKSSVHLISFQSSFSKTKLLNVKEGNNPPDS